MLTTKQFVTLLNDDFMPKLDREKVREYLSRAYLRLMSTDNTQAIFHNSADPDVAFPILKLSADTRKYTIDGTTLVDSDGNPVSITRSYGGTDYTLTIRRVKGCFIVGAPTSYFAYSKYLHSYEPYGYSSYFSNSRRGDEVYQVPAIQEEGDYGQPATVEFFFDPNTLNGKNIYIEAYYVPPALTADSIPMFINTERWYRALKDGAVGYYEDAINGKSECLERFEKVHLKEFASYQNRSFTSQKSNQIMTREV